MLDSFTRLYNELISENASETKLAHKTFNIKIERVDGKFVFTLPENSVFESGGNKTFAKSISVNTIKEGFKQIAENINETYFGSPNLVGKENEDKEVLSEGDGREGCGCGPKDGKKKDFGENDNCKNDENCKSGGGEECECGGRKKKLDPSKQKLHRR